MDIFVKKPKFLSLKPKMSRSYRLAQEFFSLAGIEINGTQAYDIQVHNDAFYQRFFSQGILGYGESYMDRWWDCEDLAEHRSRLFKANPNKQVRGDLKFIFNYLLVKAFNFQNIRRSYEVARRHYDLGNDLFSAMLDKRMTYSCGYWRNAKTLEEAQENKLNLVCQKLRLRPGMKMLDIGCGWGGLAKFAAENYGVSVVGITLSIEQLKLAKEICKGLPIELRLQDYRDLNEKYDRIASLGMFEAVGHKNFGTFMETVNRCLMEDGLFLLQTIGANRPIVARTDGPWVEKYIFPNCALPSIKQIGEATDGRFIMEDWHNFGTDYEKTLQVWYDNFKANWGKLKAKYDDRFYRMWEFFLLSSIGMFRSRYFQLWQIVFSKKGVPEGYQQYVNYQF